MEVGLEPKNRDQEKQARMVVYIILFLILIIAVFIFFSLKAKSSKFIYNDEFEVYRIKDNDYVHYKIKIFVNDNSQPFLIDIKKDPREIEMIPMDKGIREKLLNSKQIFVTITPNTNLTSETAMAAFEIEKIIDNPYLFNIPVNSSFTESYKDYPVKTCDDVSDEVSVVWLKRGDETKINFEDSCIIMTGITEDDLIKAADKLVLNVLGIIK
jgi:hypothetical protein